MKQSTKAKNELKRAALTLLESLSRDENPAATTIGVIFDLMWKEKHKDSEKDWSLETKRLYVKKIEPVFKDRNINHITARTVREWHKRMEDTPIQANRALNVLSSIFRYAEEQEIKPQSTNPCRLVKPFREVKRKRFATIIELKKIHKLLMKENVKNPRAVAFLLTLLYTGARPRSLEKAIWNDMEITKHEDKYFGVLTFNGKTTAKTGDQEQVIVPPQAMELINNIPKQKHNLIFGIKMPKEIWDRVREKAGCKDLWARDFRRTFATIGLSNGENIGVIGELLNHKSSETTKIYAKLVEEKRFSVVSSIANTLDKELKK